MFFKYSLLMKLFHDISINVFIKEDEDYDILKSSFLKLFPFNLDDMKVLLLESKASTFNNKFITILEVKLTRNKLINDFMDSIKEKLSQNDKDMVVDQIDSRIDEDSNFFIRLDKKKLILESKYIVTDDGDCFHLKCNVATYPVNKEKAKKVIIDYFS
jgi:RNA binding exosome subunit